MEKAKAWAMLTRGREGKGGREERRREGEGTGNSAHIFFSSRA
jgi:hypothetical protein